MLKITIIACGNKMPAWVEEGVAEFSKRLKEYVQIQLVEIPLIKRSKSSGITKILEKEASLIAAALPLNARIIALEIDGQMFSSEQLAIKLESLQQISSHLCILIGGPEGLIEQTKKLCQECWSLSKLTLPHPLVRLILLETLYRAFSIIHNHPYHK
jgi:23S rRNA (pseudouridine1915-N3)-methyltransferase